MKQLRHIIRCILLEDITRHLDDGISILELPDYGVGTPINISRELDDPKNIKLRNHVWSMIQDSYGNKAGEGWYPSPDDLIGHGMNMFHVYDLNGDGVANVFFAGWKSSKSSYGKIKMVQSGSDGSADGVAFYKKEIVRWIESGEAILEASGAPAAILMKAGVPPMNEETVMKFFPKPKKTWWGKHPDPQSRDAQNAAKYGPKGEYDAWCGRKFKNKNPIVKMWWGIL